MVPGEAISVDRIYRSGDIIVAFTDDLGPVDQAFALVHGISSGRVVCAEVARWSQR